MTFQPVLPIAVLILAGVVLLGIRVVTLRRGATLLRWSGVTLAVLLLVIAAARPGITGGQAEARTTADDTDLNVFFVVDRSIATRVADFGDRTSRMAGIRRDISALIDQYPDARFAVISFASSSDLDWPVSEDVWSLKPLIAGMAPYASDAPGALSDVNAAAGSDILRYELEQTAQQFPGSTNLVFYLGSGTDESTAPRVGFDFEATKIDGGAVLGYGTPVGGPIPREIVNGQVLYAVDPRNGTELRSAIDEPALTAIADELKVPYLHRADGDSIAPVVAAADVDRTAAVPSTAPAGNPIELYWVFALVAAALVLPEIYLTLRQFRRNRAPRQEESS